MVSHLKRLMRFGLKGKISPCFIGPFQIMEHIETIVYRLALPPQVARVHIVLHISMLWKYIGNPSDTLLERVWGLLEE